MTDPGWADVVGRINDELGTVYELVRPLSGGRQGGAWIVVDEAASAKSESVLTWTLNPRLAARREETAWLVDRLRGRGYPTPQWRAWGAFEDGVAYVIADLFHGTAASWADLGAQTLIHAVELQAGLARPAAASWSGYLRQVLSSDSGPRGDVAALDGDGASFLHLIDGAAASLDVTALPETDAVHGDLEAGNVLLAHPRDSEGGIGIVDIDACGGGTRAIDYAWLVRDATAHDAPEPSIALLRQAGVAVAGPEVWTACVAFACVELVGFVARSGNRAGAAAEIRRLRPLLRKETTG